MSVGQNDLFRTERIVTPPALRPIERENGHADPQGRQRRRRDAQEEPEADAAPQDSVEWSDAARQETADTAALPKAEAAPLLSLPAAHHLDLTV